MPHIRFVLEGWRNCYCTTWRSILYQRGIYPDDEFQPVKKYNMTIMITKDGGLRDYLSQVLQQINGTLQEWRGLPELNWNEQTLSPRSPPAWIASGDIQKLVVVIADQKTKETKERWTFDIQLDKDAAAGFGFAFRLSKRHRARVALTVLVVFFCSFLS